VPVERGPAFARALWRIAAANVTAGNQIRLYSDGDETFDAMIEIIDRAESHVELESYIYKPDLVGRRFADALAAAAKRGVRARLLTDWIGMRGTPASFMRALRARGVEVRVFNPPHWRPWFGIVPRDHRKLVVGDSKVGITGGIGIGEEWQHGILRKRRQAWRDTCVRITGPAAADLSGSFEGMWLRAAGIRPPRSERLLTKTARGSELGVRVWEWSGEMMHAKTTVVDGRWTRVGSTDFNPLSVAINYELDAMIEDATVGVEAEHMFERDLAMSREVTSRYPER
jgi:phosphatidylserine/phosphatidylglycerophosphate/cardiolipin synthase-like enzyme